MKSSHSFRSRCFLGLAASFALAASHGCAQAQPANAPIVEAGKIAKIGEGVLQEPLSIRASPRGDLIVLDKRGDGFSVSQWSREGRKTSETPLPAEIKNPNLALMDASGTLYITAPNQRNLWILKAGEAVRQFDSGAPISGATIKKIGAEEAIYLTGNRDDGLRRLSLPDLKAEKIALSSYPEKGILSEPRVRDDGHFYAFSEAEHLVWHFDENGQFIEKFGGGGPAPPRVGMPADYMGQFYDVAPRGDIFWSLADYGALLRLSADGKMGAHFRGEDKNGARWTGPLYTLSGMALSGDRAYVIDRGLKRITAFPLSTVDAGAPDVQSIDARAFGLNYQIVSDAPYKLFTGATATVSVALDEGHRTLHNAQLQYELFDLSHKPISGGKVLLTLSGDAAQKIAVPPIALPSLGWYQLESSISDGQTTFAERVDWLSRTVVDARLPIPDKETSGWNDIATHQMIGMGLHRFAGKVADHLGDDRHKEIALAKQLGTPYFIQLTDKPEVTPANVEAVLKAYPDLPILEIMNEPDQQGVSPESYVADYLKPCYERAKQINPKVQILGPTKTGIELGWMEKFFAAGGGNYVDAISVHTYERHNSMDVYHWNWKLDKLRALMKANNCGDKLLYQTEHGFLGDYHEFIVRPQWQGRSLFLEFEALQRSGVSAAQNYYYYVNEGGFRDFSAYLVDRRRELFPAATLLRTRAHLIGERRFAASLDFGAPGNWLLLGNRYEGAATDVLVLVNTGAARDIPVRFNLPPAARVFDCFGNTPTRKPGVSIAVGRYPTYIEVPHGTPLIPQMETFGQNIAPQAKVVVDDEKAQASAPRLTNGALEFDFADQPERVGFLATDNKLPLDVTLQWDTPRTIGAAILYGAFADNDKSTPLEYQVALRIDGQWKMVDEIKQSAASRTLKLGNVTHLSEYDNPWIFVHRFTPTRADAIRFHFTATTHGQFPNLQSATEIDGGWGNPPRPQRVELREAQVFETP